MKRPMLKRREFGQTLVSGALAAGVPVSAAATARPAKKNTLMHVGGDYHTVAGSGITGRENLQYQLRCGVKHLTVQMRKRGDDCDRAGVTLEAIRMDADYIMHPKGADRDRAIETIVHNIEKAAQNGVRI